MAGLDTRNHVQVSPAGITFRAAHAAREHSRQVLDAQEFPRKGEPNRPVACLTV